MSEYTLRNIKLQLESELERYIDAIKGRKKTAKLTDLVEKLKEKIELITSTLESENKDEINKLNETLTEENILNLDKIEILSESSEESLEVQAGNSDINSSDYEENTHYTKMALDNEKVIHLVTKLIKDDYDGKPEGLAQFIKILNVIKSTITHPDNKVQVLSLIALRLKGKAEDAVSEKVDSIDEIISSLKNKCSGKTVSQIRSSLAEIECHNKDLYTTKLIELNSSLKLAYKNMGMDRENADKLALSDIKSNIKTNFVSNIIIQAATMQEYEGIDELISKFQEAVLISKNKNQANILNISGTSQRGRGNYRGRRPFNNYRNNYNNNYRGNNYSDNNYNHNTNRNNNNNYNDNTGSGSRGLTRPYQSNSNNNRNGRGYYNRSSNNTNNHNNNNSNSTPRTRVVESENE
jgi:hypothetical protein